MSDTLSSRASGVNPGKRYASFMCRFSVSIVSIVAITQICISTGWHNASNSNGTRPLYTKKLPTDKSEEPEYFRIIEKIGKKNPSIVNEWKMLLLDLLNIVEATEEISICRDEYDDMFIECAVACGAKYIVSGDEDLLVLEKYREIQIITPKKYLEMKNETA